MESPCRSHDSETKTFSSTSDIQQLQPQSSTKSRLLDTTGTPPSSQNNENQISLESSHASDASPNSQLENFDEKLNDSDLENQDLQFATVQTKNVVMELALDGTILYLSDTWKDITGYVNIYISNILYKSYISNFVSFLFFYFILTKN